MKRNIQNLILLFLSFFLDEKGAKNQVESKAIASHRLRLRFRLPSFCPPPRHATAGQKAPFRLS
ncbi:MAG TPA: hypothetical protein PKA85_03705 [Ferruginibacter sp.]|nr:hypothetical protein [Ferruginibacter sp.]